MLKYMTMQYMNEVINFNDKDYLLAMISFYAAPTFKRYKSSSIITLKNYGRNLYGLWDKYSEEIMGNYSHIKCYELKRNKDSLILMLYDEKLLLRTLYCKENINFLKGFGYRRDMDLLDMLELLKERYSVVCPHEMGIFLGFPLKDVKEYMRNPEGRGLLTGYWKVYSDLEEAKKKFQQFDYARMNLILNTLNTKAVNSQFSIM